MRYIVSAALFLGLTGVVFGQGHPGGQFWSLGGFGSVLYPATGHAPQTPPGGVTGPHYPRGFINPGPVSHPQHGRTGIVPYPVYYGGFYGYDPSAGFGPGYSNGDQGPSADSNAVPSVVINQTFVPQQSNPVVRDYTGDQPPGQQSELKLYPAPSSHPYSDAQNATQPAQRAVAGDQPTLYLIAFKDHSIVQALGFWMEGSTLHYVSVEHTLNQASINLIDRDLSQRLNDERGLDFRLPAAH